MRALTSSVRGVSCREARSASAGTSGAYFRASRTAFSAGRVAQPDTVVGEVGQLDDPCPRARGQAVRDMLAVLLIRIASGCVDRVSHRGHELRDPRPIVGGSANAPGRPAAHSSQAWSSTASCSIAAQITSGSRTP